MEVEHLYSECQWEEWKKARRQEYPHETIEFPNTGGDCPSSYPCVVVWQVHYPNDYFAFDYVLIGAFQ
jgi:hypothetical protein